MTRKTAFIVLVSFLCATPMIYAEDTWIQTLSLDARIDYAEKYMWRGFDLQDGDPALQPSLTLDFGDTGLYSGTWGNYATDAEWHQWDEIDVFIGYYHTFWEQERHALEVDVYYTYFYFPRQARELDTHEVALELKFPQIIPGIGSSGLVPYASLYYGRSVTGDADDGLWIKLGMDYDLPIPAALAIQKGQNLNIYVETFHNDGAQGFEVAPGWSHVATGMSTTFKYHGIDFTPSINYQWTWEDTVNEEDEFWFTFSISYQFQKK